MFSYEQIGKRLRETRKQLGFSQADIAEKLDMSRPTVSVVQRLLCITNFGGLLPS